MNDGSFRIYVLRDEEPHCIASCEEDSLGFALRTLTDEQQIVAGDCVGILERTELVSRWIVNPWPATPFGTRA